MILVGLLLANSMFVFADTHVVEEGDVLWKIAEKYNTSVEEIMSLNELKDPNIIYPGDEITISEEKTLSNAEKAVAVIESLGTSNTQPVAYINPNKYIQHNLGVKDGLAGFGELVSILPENTRGKNIRVFEDGDYVFMHNEYEFFGPKVGFDIFRFEDGLIVEHWDNLAELAADVNVSGRSQLDGSRLIQDLDQTENNRILVQNLLRDVFLGEAPEKITDYISTEKYFQHNTGVADGLEGLGQALQALAEAGMPMVYTKNHMVLAQGNFVLAVSEGEFMNNHVSFYDLFRIEDGKVIEHWDTIETIPESSEWMNTNGKF